MMDGADNAVQNGVVDMLVGLGRRDVGLVRATLEPLVRKLWEQTSGDAEQVTAAFAGFGGMSAVYHNTGEYRLMGEGAFVFTFIYADRPVIHTVYV